MASTTGQAVDDTPEYRVLVVERRRIAGDDEERGRGARRIVAARHREDAFDVLGVVELRRQRPNHLLLLLGQRTARRHRSGLDDETADDAMERRPVVDARGGQSKEVADVFRRLVRKELDGDGAGRRLEDRAIRRELRRRFSGEWLWLRRRRVADDDAANLDPILGQALVIRGRLGNLLDYVEAFGDASEDRVRCPAVPVDR